MCEVRMNNKSSLNIPSEVFEILVKELHQYSLNDDDVCNELFEESKKNIEIYRTAVEHSSTIMLSRETIGIACYWLLLLSDLTENDKHWKLVIQLLSVDKGLSLYQHLNEVLELKKDAIENLDLIVQKAQLKHNNTKQYEDVF